jgi:enterochelin esterase family protein
MHDGKEFLEYSAFGTVLDNLMHRRLMADCFVACTHPGNRMREYTANPAHTRFVNNELVPELERTLPVGGEPRLRVLGGASLGAVAALAAAVKRPGAYGGLLLESGSFRSFLPGGMPALANVARFVRGVQAKPKRVTGRIFHTFGAFEPLAEPNRAMVSVLQRMAGEVRSEESLDGHNWTNWRDRLLDGLQFLLPPDDAAELGAA